MSETNHSPLPCEFDIDKLIIELDALVPSDIAIIERTAAKIARLIEKSRCWDETETVDLALREALANAIVHGNHSDPATSVRICVGIEPDCNVLIIVKDAGSGFDLSQLPNPVFGENVLRAHGRGIFLLNHLMEDVKYRFDHGTAIYMRRKLASH